MSRVALSRPAVIAFLTMIGQWEPLVLKQAGTGDERAEPVPA
jgi:hypothetical protein